MASIATWLEALDLLMSRMKNNGADFSLVSAISGTAQVRITIITFRPRKARARRSVNHQNLLNPDNYPQGKVQKIKTLLVIDTYPCSSSRITHPRKPPVALYEVGVLPRCK